MHARQNSRKVKAALHTKFANGLHIGAYSLIGYMRDLEQKGHLPIDPETRWIVEKIFDLALHGMRAAKITHILHRDKVPTPGYINYQRCGTFAHIYAGQPEEKAQDWLIGHVKCILKNSQGLVQCTISNTADCPSITP